MLALLALVDPASAGAVTLAEPVGLAAATGPRRVALVVGVDAYTGGLPSLRFAAKDARDFAAVLRDPAGGAFDEVRLLEGTVTLDALRAAFKSITARIAEQDTFVLYFAGHGTLTLDVDGSHQYLLTSESSLDEARTTGLSVSLVQDAIETLPARQRVLIVDACYNGSGRSALAASTVDRLRSLRGNLPPPAPRVVSRFDAYLFAAHLNQPSMEDPSLDNGVYTHYLVDALRGNGDVDGDGLVDVIEAFQYARDGTLAYTAGAQVPWLQSTVVGRARIFLAGDPSRRRRAERAIIAGLSELPRGATLSIDGKPRGEGAVEPGTHLVEVFVDGEKMLSTTMRVSPGERLDLDELANGRGAQWLLGVGGGWTEPGEIAEGEGINAPGSLALEGWFWPRDVGGGRLGLGARAGLGLGAVPGLDYFPTGDGAVMASYGWGRNLVVGPMLGGGLLWRLPTGGPQAGAFVEGGFHAHYTTGRFFGGLEATLQVQPEPVDGVLYSPPAARAVAGVRL